ncbi:uncharacterized protein [Coffea arabica]|uniref:Uncharacterized protein n=1 Tax=Coffea arabica TaxID=13443 RepID=A0A6P6X322_COFAR|nr:uncharacterized protein LOC113739081 [Coffea arabica]
MSLLLYVYPALISKPWQFNKGIHFDGISNKYSFQHCNRKAFLVPLTPNQVHEDQESLQKEWEIENEKRQKEKAKSIKVSELAKQCERKKAYLESAKESFEDFFPEEIPSGLLPIRGIKHQIDLVLRASLLNKPAYRMESEETKELQYQVDELLKKGWA